MAKTWSGCCSTAFKKICLFFPLGGCEDTFPPFCHMFFDFLQGGSRVCTWTAEGHGWLCGTHSTLPASLPPSLPRELKRCLPPAEPYKLFLHMHFSRF